MAERALSAQDNRVGIPSEDVPTSETGNQLHGAKRFEVLAAVMVAMFFSSMAQTVVSTALPNIISDLHGLNLYAWVFTAFILASAVVIPVYGKLSDVFGRKPLFIVAISLYVVGNAASGFSQNMEMLVAARALAGLGGGGMQALSQITIGDIFSPQERGRWIGLMMSVFGLASIIGPTLGGFITDHFTWRWVFWVNVPFGILPMLALIYALPSIRPGRMVRIDYRGIALLIAGLMPLLLAITWIGEGMSWTSPRVLVGLLASPVLLLLFVWQEMTAEEPLIEPSFFKNSVFLTCMLASFCLALGMYGAIMFIPLFVQGVVGTSAQDSGIVLAPMMLGFIVGSFITGQLVSRWGRYRILAVAGLAVGSFGAFLFARMGVGTSNAIVVRNMVVFGLGIGGTMPLFTIAVQNAFPYRVLGAVTGARQFFTSLGGAIGVPIMGAMLNSGFRDEFLHHLSPALQAVMQRQGGASLNPSTLISAEAQTAIRSKFLQLGPNGAHLYTSFIAAVRQSLAVSISSLFHLALAFLLVALVITLFLKEIPLRSAHDFEEELATTDESAAITGTAAPEPIRERTRADSA